VVAEDEMHRATGGRGLLLQAVQQPERLGHLRPAVEHVAGHHQRVGAERPVILCVDDPVRAQQPHQQVVLAVDVRHRDDARRRRRDRQRRRRRRTQRKRLSEVACRRRVEMVAAASRMVL